MFTVKSYIKNPILKISDLEKMIQNPEIYFLDMDDTQSIEKYYYLFNLDYLDGAIVLKYNDEVLMDFIQWDIVDQLWSYVINLLEDFLDKGEGGIYFPDQPIKLTIKKVSRPYLLFSIKKQLWTLETDSFLRCMLDGAEYFFKRMISLTGQENGYYEAELTRIENLRSKLLSE